MGLPAIIGILMIATIIYIIIIYNQLVTLKNRYLNSFSQINIQLQRRHDLIPNLVEIAKQYITHERETLENVIAARNSAKNQLSKTNKNFDQPNLIQELGDAETRLSSALSHFNVVVEAYPELKANESMARLTEELSSTENRVAFARQSYNDNVMEYNIYKQKFPNNTIANLLSHHQNAHLLEFEDSQLIQQAPQIKF